MSVVQAPLRIVLLGGTGFVGSAFLRRLNLLVENSVEVHALVRNPKQEFPYPFVRTIAGELSAIPSELFPKAPYVVVHLGTKQVDLEGTGFEKANVEGTRRLLEAMTSDALGVVYGSSMSVYGEGKQEGVQENAKIQPQTDLAQSHAASEALILGKMTAQNKSAFVLRPRFLMGSGDRLTMPGFLTLVEKRILIGTGNQKFSIMDVDDYGEIILTLAQKIVSRASEKTSTCRALNIGYRQPVSLQQILMELRTTYQLPDTKLTLPLPAWVPQILHRLPAKKTQSLAKQIELVGFSHFSDTTELETEIGKEIVLKNPYQAVRKAIQILLAQDVEKETSDPDN
ncbi:NAD(P)-dependent oxidoreductase [Deltaproteobacteria bacterium TL4]